MAGCRIFHLEPQAKEQLCRTIEPPGAKPPALLVGSTGIKFLGDGDWLSRKPGTHCRRQYRKVHLAMDTSTGDVRAVDFTSSREGDSPVLPDLLAPIPPVQMIDTVTGDGAFDTRRWPVMTSSGRPGDLGGLSGSGGRAITSAVGSRRRCAVSKPLAGGSHHETPTAKSSNPHPHCTHDPRQRARPNRDRRRRRTPKGKGAITFQAGVTQRHPARLSG